MNKRSTQGLKRDPGLYKRLLTKTKSGQIIVNDDCVVLFPERYLNKNLAVIDSEIKVLGIFAILDTKGKYSVCNIPAYLSLSPSNTLDTKMDDILFKELEFKKDSIFMDGSKIVKTEEFVFKLFDEFFIRGNIPWFMDYEDLSSIFRYGKKYAGTNLGNDPVTWELLTSVASRNPEDRLEYFRTIIKNVNDKNKKPAYTALLSIYYSFNNTVNKLVGSYMDKGITSALVNPSENVENVEKLLRA
jgi:hypothetical protein